MSRDEYDFKDAKQGRVAARTSGKTRITIRIDTDVLDWFRRQVHKRGGGSYQALINEALREHTNARSGQLESIVRKVIREEIKSAESRAASAASH